MNKRKKRAEKKLTPEEFYSSIESTPEYVKHAVECRCILPQFKTWDDPPNHKFVVFSELNEQADVVPSLAQCNNCGIVHRILEVNQSETLRKEESLALPKKDDFKGMLPDWLIAQLETHDCDLATWQEANFIYTNKLFGRFIVLARERETNSTVMVKICQILGENLHKIETAEIEEDF